MGREKLLSSKSLNIYDGEIAGRRNPSYPVGTNDYTRVNAAIQKLLAYKENDELQYV
ncbi:hypothetical protein ABFY48_18375 [Lysinibacillus pakistanensis]|uniref:hypothetical protein n=1 Tax=Lysinibacillus pakistanensis TaxID=759811 RepID=UPI003D2CFD5E